MANISFNPQLTSSPQSSFLQQTEGYVQGAFFDDTTSRMQLVAGIIASTVTGPVWGGMAITENVPAPNAGQNGNSLVLATTNAGITAFTVFNQANNMVIVPGNTVQQAVAGMSMSYFRLGSNARIGVQCDPTLAANLDNGAINQQVSWDFVNQLLVPYTPGYAANTITNAVWASTAGGQTTYTVSTNPTALVFPGDRILVSGVVNTGGASTSAFNGDWIVVSTSATTIVVSAPSSVSLGTYASGGTVNAAAGGILAVKTLSVNTNSKIVNYNSTTGALTYSTGAVAIVQI
jgi:hypothetical protein